MYLRNDEADKFIQVARPVFFSSFRTGACIEPAHGILVQIKPDDDPEMTQSFICTVEVAEKLIAALNQKILMIQRFSHGTKPKPSSDEEPS